MPRDGLLRGMEVEPLDREVRPQTPQEKRKNWWYYHRVPLLAALAAAAVAFSIFWSIFSKVQPDYTVALITSYTMPDSGVEQLSSRLAEYAGDRNGDGKVVVNVANYTFSTSMPATPDAANQQEAEAAKLAVDAATNESMIFFYDLAVFDFLETNFGGFFLYNDGTPMPEGAEDFENARRAWSDFASLASFKPEVEVDSLVTEDLLLELYGRLYVSFRAAEGTSIEKNEKDLAYYQDCRTLYERLLTGSLS